MTRPPRIENLLREAAPQVLAALARRFDSFADAEDAVQEALVTAASEWPSRGLPENPVGWLIHVASRRMIDGLRSQEARRAREELSVAQEPSEPAGWTDTTVSSSSDSFCFR